MKKKNYKKIFFFYHFLKFFFFKLKYFRCVLCIRFTSVFYKFICLVIYKNYTQGLILFYNSYNILHIFDGL